ncbi:MAG: phosphonoacetaldehyde reductase [Clostridia bacterium]|nr:phosphonoacetaldehyde reductase [Clostridia bacterium]
MAQHVVRGQGSLNGANILALLEALSVQRPLLVCGGRMAEVFRSRTGLALPVFSGYHPNPDLADSEAGAAMYRAEGCDGLISLGGGSAMDTAKAIKALLLTGDMARVKASDLPQDVWLPHIAIPGTAGTGSEATPFAVVYVDGQKLSLDHPQLLPEAVVLDSTLLATLPEYHRKACAMDALAQGIESFWARAATAESRIHAERAIRGVVFNMSAYLADDPAARDALLEAAYESGLAIATSRTTAAHAMSYQITRLLGPAHGHACMLTLPHLWAHLYESGTQPEPLEKMAEILGLPNGFYGSVLLQGLLLEMGLDIRERPDEATLDALTASVNAQRLGNHPEPLTTAELRRIYEDALTPMDWGTKEAAQALWRQYGG